MSEPFSLVGSILIPPGELHAAFEDPVSPPPDRGFWEPLGLDLSPADWSRIENISRLPLKEFLRQLRAEARPALHWHFEYDKSQRRLNLADLLFSGSPPEIIAGLSVLSALLKMPANNGYILVHDFAFDDQQTFCAIRRSVHGIELVGPHGAAVQQLVVEARPLARAIRARADAFHDAGDESAPPRHLSDDFPYWA